MHLNKLLEEINEKIPCSDEESIYLCLNYYVMTKMKDPKDFFFKYLNFLPKSLTEYPLFYSNSDLEKLKGSFFIQDIAQAKSFEKKNFRYFQRKYPNIMKTFILEDYIRASILVGSRIFEVKCKGNKSINELMLTPISDLFNHSFNSNADWNYNNDYQTFEIFASRDIKIGEEVNICYSKSGNNILLMNYGFTIEDNTHGMISICCEYYLKKRKSSLMQKIENLEIFKKSKFELEIHFNNWTILQKFKIFRLFFYYSNERTEPDSLIPDGENIISIKNELKVCNLFIEMMHSMWKEYSTTLEEDKLFLKTNRNSIQFNKDLYVVLIEEKQIIENNFKKLKLMKECLESKSLILIQTVESDDILEQYLVNLKKILNCE